MRFRTLLFLGLCAVAFIPGAVLTVAQLHDADERAASSDAVLTQTASNVRDNISNRLLTAQHLVRITAYMAALGWGAKFGPEGSSIIGSPSGNPE